MGMWGFCALHVNYSLCLDFLDGIIRLYVTLVGFINDMYYLIAGAA